MSKDNDEDTRPVDLGTPPARHRQYGWKFPVDQRLTPLEAAEYLNRTPETLARWRALGQGPRYYKIGDKGRSPIFYMSYDLDDYIELAGARNTTAQPVDDEAA